MKTNRFFAIAALALCVALPARAQQHAAPTQSGNAVFATLAEVVRILRADSATDWATVNLEALRLHLVDMDEVLVRATVVQRPIEGGLEIRATGTGRTVAALRRMGAAHAMALASSPDYRLVAAEIPGGIRLIVTAARPGDAALVAQIRGLGFAGLLTEGDHHGPHHLALARGQAGSHGH